jgi:hypothetical protein
MAAVKSAATMAPHNPNARRERGCKGRFDEDIIVARNHGNFKCWQYIGLDSIAVLNSKGSALGELQSNTEAPSLQYYAAALNPTQDTPHFLCVFLCALRLALTVPVQP